MRGFCQMKLEAIYGMVSKLGWSKEKFIKQHIL